MNRDAAIDLLRGTPICAGQGAPGRGSRSVIVGRSSPEGTPTQAVCRLGTGLHSPGGARRVPSSMSTSPSRGWSRLLPRRSEALYARRDTSALDDEQQFKDAADVAFAFMSRLGFGA
jgi:hypothetical protein